MQIRKLRDGHADIGVAHRQRIDIARLVRWQ
jgi:hypothetical protein